MFIDNEYILDLYEREQNRLERRREAIERLKELDKDNEIDEERIAGKSKATTRKN